MKKNILIAISIIIILGLGLYFNPEKNEQSEKKEDFDLSSIESLMEKPIDYKKTPSKEDYSNSDGIYLKKIRVMDERKKQQLNHSLSVIKIFNSNGVERLGEFKIPYDSKNEEVKLINLKTINSDGSTHKPTEKEINDITPANESNASIYSDRKIKTISMPAVEPGSILVCEYAVLTKERTIENEFHHTWFFQTSLPVLESKLTLKTPKDKKVHYEMLNNDITPDIEKEENYTKYTWKATNIPKFISEPNMTSSNEFLSKVEITTLSSWNQVSDWYQSFITDQYKVNEPIKNKISELTKGKSTEEEKIEALYNYVTNNIRYIGMQFGKSGYKPYSAIETYNNKYGVCKEKATLLIALLRDIDVKAEPVLINRGNEFINIDFVSPNQFNHLIVYLPEYDLFLDPTTKNTIFKLLPGDQGKQALLPESKRIIETPINDKSFNESIWNQKIEIQKNNKANISLNTNFSGLNSFRMKHIFQPIDKEKHPLAIKQLLTSGFGEITIENQSITGVLDSSKKVLIDVPKLEANNYYQNINNQIIIKPVKMPLNLSQFTASNERKYPLYFTNNQLRKMNYTIKIPEGYNLKNLPETVDFKNKIGSLKIKYSKSNNNIILNTSYSIEKNVIPNDLYHEAKTLFTKIDNLRNIQIILEKN